MTMYEVTEITNDNDICVDRTFLKILQTSPTFPRVRPMQGRPKDSQFSKDF
jgi:hypothetical protein